LLCDAAERATVILTEQREKLDTLAKRLEEVETLDDSEIEQLIGPAVNKHGSPTLEIASHRAPETTP
jgi:ATP-dependent Zn protease